MTKLFRTYARENKVSIAQAIADKGYSRDRYTCISWFRDAAGRFPTLGELKVMINPKSLV